MSIDSLDNMGIVGGPSTESVNCATFATVQRQKGKEIAKSDYSGS